VSTHERNLDAHITRALQELLAGREPHADDTTLFTGEVKACIDALLDALHADGVQAVRKAFTALVKDRPWLGKLAAQAAEDDAQGQGSVRRIRFLPDSEFENRPPRQWLIPSILPRSGIAMAFGPPGCGKSFLTIDWSLCIASGTQWLGRSVLQGPVAYIAGEGAFGLGPRIKAWKYQHRFTGNSGVQWFDETIALQDAGTLSELLTALTEDFTDPPVLVVIDTLSRCSGGADENSNTEMARVIASADLLQQQFHCTVLIVHHAGKDKDKGPRGASSLIGNTETILEVAPTEEGCRVICYKQKDAPKFEPISLKLQQIWYGPGDEDNSAVLVVGNEQAPLKMTRSETLMYTALIGKDLTYSEWVQAGLAYASQLKEKLAERSAQGAIAKLYKAGRVQQIGKRYSILPEQQAIEES
jgi:hypothetical protein